MTSERTLLKKWDKAKKARKNDTIMAIWTNFNRDQLFGIITRKTYASYFNGFIYEDKAWPLENIYDLDSLVRFGSLVVYNAMCMFSGKDETERYNNGKAFLLNKLNELEIQIGKKMDVDEVRDAFDTVYTIRMQIGAHLDNNEYWTLKKDFSYFEMMDPKDTKLKETMVVALQRITQASQVINFVTLNTQWKGENNCYVALSPNWPKKVDYLTPIQKMKDKIEEVKTRASGLPELTLSVDTPDKRKVFTALHLLTVTDKLLDIYEQVDKSPTISSTSNDLINTSAIRKNKLLALETAALVTYHQAKSLARKLTGFAYGTGTPESKREEEAGRLFAGYKHFDVIRNQIVLEDKGNRYWEMTVNEDNVKAQRLSYSIMELKGHISDRKTAYQKFVVTP